MNLDPPHASEKIVDDSMIASREMRAFIDILIRLVNPVSYAVPSSQTTNSGNGTYVLQSSVTLTLGVPEEGDEVVIHRNYAGAASTVDGGALNINGSGTYSMSTNRETLKLKYLGIVGEWVIL